MQEDKDESISDEGGDIATSLSIDEERIDIESSDSPHYENIPVQIMQEDKDVFISDEGGDFDATSLSIDEDTIDFSLISTAVMTQLMEQLSPRIPLSFHVILLAFH